MFPPCAETFESLNRILWHTQHYFLNEFSLKWSELKLCHIEFSKFEHPHGICIFMIIDNFPLDLLQKMAARVLTQLNFRKCELPHGICIFIILDNLPLDLLQKIAARDLTHWIFEIWTSAWYLYIYDSGQFPFGFTTENGSFAYKTPRHFSLDLLQKWEKMMNSRGCAPVFEAR